MPISVAFFDILFLAVINYFAIRYLYRLVISNKKPIEKFIDELPVTLLTRLKEPNVLASLFISLVFAFLTVIIVATLPNNFPLLVEKQISLLQSYVALFNHYKNMVTTNQISIHNLIKMILAKQFTLQNIIDFAYLNRLVLIPLFLIWCVNFVFRIYLYFVDIKREKIKSPEDILICALFFYGTGLAICLMTKIFHLVPLMPLMPYFVFIETLIFWFFMICSGARFGFIYDMYNEFGKTKF